MTPNQDIFATENSSNIEVIFMKAYLVLHSTIVNYIGYIAFSDATNKIKSSYIFDYSESKNDSSAALINNLKIFEQTVRIRDESFDTTQ